MTSGVFRIKPGDSPGFSYEKASRDRLRPPGAKDTWYDGQQCFYAARASFASFLAIKKRSRVKPEGI
jgi:hypothetical protein